MLLAFWVDLGCSEKFLQIDYPHLGKLCNLVIPCALTALDHWSPEVKVCILISLLPSLILANSDLCCVKKKLIS